MDSASASAGPRAPLRSRPKFNGRRFLSSPAIIYLIVVTQVPFALTIWFAFSNWNLLRPNSAGFRGFGQLIRNLTRVLTDPDFLTVLFNTVYLTVAVVVVTFILGMLFAILLDRPFPGRNLARTLLISPFLLMPVASAVLWKNLMLDPSFGLSAWLMQLFGMQSVYLVQEAPMLSIIGIVSWQWTPFMMLILLAGLQSLPDETREAAWLDGAGPVTMFRFIILPHLRRFIEIAVLLEVIFVLNIFGEIFVITSGGPGLQTTNLPYQIYLEAFSRWNLGIASTYGLIAIILANLVIVAFVQVLRQKRMETA